MTLNLNPIYLDPMSLKFVRQNIIAARFLSKEAHSFLLRFIAKSNSRWFAF
jgi:hypothetical protein